MDGDLSKEELSRYAAKKGPSRVHLVGPLVGPGLHEAYLASDGYISLSARENFSYSMTDALGYGLAVILSRGQYLAADAPSRGEGSLASGWLLPDDSLGAATAAIDEFARSSTQQLVDFGQRGREWVAETLSWERFASAVRSLADF